MSKRLFKSQASSGRAAGGFGALSSGGFSSTKSSVLSYVQEPPDYSTISDANTVVAFKNLSKKDSTTKAKALEDLQASTLGEGTEVQDAVLETWVLLFPRLSIDNDRRVRQLAYNFNGHLCAKCGKRVAKHLSRLAGPWLAGCYDVDRATAKAAQDGLWLVFPTSEKIHSLKKAFQESILEYCQNAVLEETAQTLSDERSVSPDDANATYARVVATGLAVITTLLKDLSQEERAQQTYLYEGVLCSTKFWQFAYHPDSAIRRSLHRLVRVCLVQQYALIADDVKHISQAYVFKGLASDQTGSASEFAETLEALSLRFPKIWTDAYVGNKSALSRFQRCLSNGSFSGSASFWDSICRVFKSIPVEILPKTYDDAAELLSAAKTGIMRKEERFNASAAWPAYFTIVDIVSGALPDDDCQSLLEAFAMPPINQYIHPSEDSVSWSITGAKSASLVSRVAVVRHLPALLERKWPHLANKLIETARLSQPEQSTEFAKSQSHVATSGERWANLQKELFDEQYSLPESTRSVFIKANITIFEECSSLLKSRNGKPYGAAAILEEQLRKCGQFLMRDETFSTVARRFVTEDIPEMIESPSQRHLTLCLYSVKSDIEINSIMDRMLQTLLNSKESRETKIKTIHTLFPQNAPPEAVQVARDNSSVQHLLASHASLNEATEMNSVFSDLLRIGVVSTTTTHAVLTRLTESLSLVDVDVDVASLTSLEQFASVNATVMQNYSASSEGQQLLTSVIKLQQSDDDTIAEKATKVLVRLTSNMGDAVTDARYGVIQQNLGNILPSSLSIDILLELTQTLLGEGVKEEDIDKLLPNQSDWMQSMIAALKPPKLSLSLMNSLGESISLIVPGWVGDAGKFPEVHFDNDGLSQAVRTSMYVLTLLRHESLREKLGDRRGLLLALLNVCVLAVEDNLSISGTNSLWDYNKNTSLEPELLDFVSDTNAFYGTYRESLTAAVAVNDQSPGGDAFNGFGILQKEHVHTPLTYYASLGDCKARDNIFELHGFNSEQMKAAEEKLKRLRLTNEPLDIASCIVGYAQPLKGSQTLTRLCNELIADLTTLDVQADSQRGLEMLVILNAILHTQDEIVDTIAKPRLIFMIKHVIQWLTCDVRTVIKAAVSRAITMLLPGYQDMYGEHWTQIVTSVVHSWSSLDAISDGERISESAVLLLHASLRLYAALDKLTKAEDVNEDLLEAFQERKDHLYHGMIGVLKSLGGISDEHHQPLMITNELLARQISRLPLKPLNDADDLFSLLYTPSTAILSAAFTLLHAHIPAAQEQISFDAALDNKVATLPDELLSLIIDPPTADPIIQTSFDRAIPTPLQGYLFSWRLVFDHFNGSSYKVKTYYIDQLKEGGYVIKFLDLVFGHLGHVRGQPVDASKFDIPNYSANLEPSPTRQLQWLLTHIYYQALLHVPTLVKSYFIDIRSRQTSNAVESWTATHISPLIITASLQSVAEWAEKSVKEDPDYENMTVKVGLRSKEVNVSYLVDEQVMAIKVVLPDAYPLVSADVQSVSRVAVKEQQWQSWLRNCKGVIAFSDGSITDGLSAWRKNVTGALKGQTECAICYSIISGDKELPTKRCPTCKNLFHAGCLYKWFKTSNASTCPLCRNPFSFN